MKRLIFFLSSKSKSQSQYSYDHIHNRALSTISNELLTHLHQAWFYGTSSLSSEKVDYCVQGQGLSKGLKLH